MEEQRASPQRLLASVACVAGAVGMGLLGWDAVGRRGWGLFPGLYLLATVALVLMAIALAAPRGVKSKLAFVGRLLELMVDFI